MKRLLPLFTLALLVLAPATQQAQAELRCSELIDNEAITVIAIDVDHDLVDAYSFMAASVGSDAVKHTTTTQTTGPLSARTRSQIAGNGIAQTQTKQHRPAHRVATNISTYAAVLNVRFIPNRDQINSANLAPYSDGWYYAYHHTRPMTWTPENLNLDGQHTYRFTMVQLA